MPSTVRQNDRGALLRRQRTHGSPELGLLGDGDSGGRPPARAPTRPAPAAAARAVEVDRLVLGDSEQPGAQVVGAAQLRVGAQGGDPGLLEAVVGFGRPGARHAEAVDVEAVLLEEGLERRKLHVKGTLAERPL